MSRVLPRKPETEVVKTMLIRPLDPNDHRQFERMLPWFTPLFVWRDSEDGHDWVRWSVPKDMAERMGFGQGCACCGKEAQAEGEHDDFLIDTMWSETDWWLEANGYNRADAPKLKPKFKPTLPDGGLMEIDPTYNIPTKEEGGPS